MLLVSDPGGGVHSSSSALSYGIHVAPHVGLLTTIARRYRTDEMGKPIMWLFGLQNCSGIVGSLLAYGISYMNGICGLSAWRWYVKVSSLDKDSSFGHN